MQRIVFVLGAGASAAGGAPLMSKFLEKAETVYGVSKERAAQSREVDPFVDCFGDFFQYMERLEQIGARMNWERTNIERVLGAIEMKAFLDMTPEQIVILRRATTYALSRTLECCVRYKRLPSGIECHEPMNTIASSIKDMMRFGRFRPRDVAVI